MPAHTSLPPVISTLSPLHGLVSVSHWAQQAHSEGPLPLISVPRTLCLQIAAARVTPSHVSGLGFAYHLNGEASPVLSMKLNTLWHTHTYFCPSPFLLYSSLRFSHLTLGQGLGLFYSLPCIYIQYLAHCLALKTCFLNKCMSEYSL